MLRQDKKTGLPKKLTQNEKMLAQGKLDSPTKRKAKQQENGPAGDQQGSYKRVE